MNNEGACAINTSPSFFIGFVLSLFYYNKFWLEAQHPAGLLSISCLSYNKGSNWLTTLFLGFYVRQ